MNVYTKAGLLLHMLRWRLTWDWRNTHKAYTIPGNPKFMGPRDAVRLIRDGDVVAFSGLGGNQRTSIMFWAMKELFQEEGRPRDLTVMIIGGTGSRGRAPGTLEELGEDGLIRRLFSGHLETFKSLLRLADAGRLELQCLPQGTMALMIDALSSGETSRLTYTGVGTFMDPRVGSGTAINDPAAEQYVSVEGDQLRYRLPKINVAVFNVPAADREGNLYIKNCALLSEIPEIARAARANGGLVIANVGRVVEKGYDKVYMPAEMVDAVVVWRGTEQVASIPHRRYWPMLTLNSPLSPAEGVERIRFVNWLLGITPRRTATDDILARLGASVFVEHVRKGAFVNVGTGLPEEVCRVLAHAGVTDDITMFSESGVIGGLPAPGIFFGVSVAPREIISSAEVFKRVYQNLDATVLGVLQADSQGNVNVSRRGKGAINYVGPGGFIDLTTAAKTVLFVSSWMVRGRFRIEGERLRVVEHGKPKFISAVDEITFNGQEQLKMGKTVLYITNVGVFQLTARGMELIRVMPGIDIRRDILDFAPMRIVLPASGEVPLVDGSIVTGRGFRPAVRSPEI